MPDDETKRLKNKIKKENLNYKEIKIWNLNYITEAVVSAAKVAAGKTSN